MPKKETLMCMGRCKRKEGKIADYYVHRMGGGVVIIGPNLERYRCHPEVTNAEAARIEIARVCHIEVISSQTVFEMSRRSLRYWPRF
jgi:hypothetical protein